MTPLRALLAVLLHGWAVCSAPAATESPAEPARRHLGALNELRAGGLACPGGPRFPPNPVPLKLDCGLWETARRRAERAASCSSEADELALESSSSAIEDALNSFKHNASHCRSMMDPNATLVGVAHSAARGQGGLHYWIQLFATDGRPQNATCLAAEAPPAGHSAALEARRLKAAGSGGSGAPAPPPAPRPVSTYEGPGETFGMIMLFAAIFVFCAGTFGSIIIGNLVLQARERKAADQVVEQPEPFTQIADPDSP